MKDTELYDRYERTLEDGLVKICRGAGLVGDMLLRSDDIDARWDDYIKDYVADAVENFNIYPEAAISWAGFLGIAVAHWWDADWQGHKDDPYRSFYGTRGWDDMDEHVLRDLLGLKLDSPEAKKISDTLLSCALARRRRSKASSCSPAPTLCYTASAQESNSSASATRPRR